MRCLSRDPSGCELTCTSPALSGVYSASCSPQISAPDQAGVPALRVAFARAEMGMGDLLRPWNGTYVAGLALALGEELVWLAFVCTTNLNRLNQATHTPIVSPPKNNRMYNARQHVSNADRLYIGIFVYATSRIRTARGVFSGFQSHVQDCWCIIITFIEVGIYECIAERRRRQLVTACRSCSCCDGVGRHGWDAVTPPLSSLLSYLLMRLRPTPNVRRFLSSRI